MASRPPIATLAARATPSSPSAVGGSQAGGGGASHAGPLRHVASGVDDEEPRGCRGRARRAPPNPRPPAWHILRHVHVHKQRSARRRLLAAAAAAEAARARARRPAADGCRPRGPRRRDAVLERCVLHARLRRPRSVRAADALYARNLRKPQDEAVSTLCAGAVQLRELSLWRCSSLIAPESAPPPRDPQPRGCSLSDDRCDIRAVPGLASLLIAGADARGERRLELSAPTDTAAPPPRSPAHTRGNERVGRVWRGRLPEPRRSMCRTSGT